MKKLFYSLLLIIFCMHSIDAIDKVYAIRKNHAASIWIQDSTIFTSTKFSQTNWSAAAPLYTSPDARDASIAVDDYGNCIAVWQASNAIYTAHLPAQGSWSQAIELAQAASHPRIAMNGSGQAVLVWTKQPCFLSSPSIQASCSIRGECWSKPETISSSAAVEPQVAIDPLGTIFAIWHTKNLCSTEGSYASFGGPWHEKIVLSPSHTKNCRIALHSDGKAVATWERTDSQTIQKATFPNMQLSLEPATSPAITRIVPNFGSTAGGNIVVITGSSFTGATNVSFGGTSTSFTVDSDLQISAVAPAGAAGSVHITVSTPSGTSSLTAYDQYTYEAAPAVLSLTPNFGSLSGGNQVTLTGENLVGVNAVSFGGAYAPGFTINSITQATVQVPPNSAGAVPVSLSSPHGTFLHSGTNNQYIYQTCPHISHLSTSYGPSSGGNQVIIYGCDFLGATNVSFGSQSASFTVDSNTQITAIAPAEKTSRSFSKEHVHVRVTTNEGTTNEHHYAYLSSFVHEPRKFHGTIHKHHGDHGNKYKLKMKWKHPHRDENVSAYAIYKDGKVEHTVSKHKRTLHTHVRSSHHLHKRYAISAVSPLGNESKKKKLHVKKT
jgi:hypothetical protein